MKILNLNVSGELTLNMSFENINVLLGENNTGKSTFVKLILYALGVNINTFIDEITKENKCNSVSIAIQTKSNNEYLITRKLPYSDIVNVFPVGDNGRILTEEVLVYNLEEYSDFLLEEELYPKDVISYGQGKTASFRYYFLLRAAVVDQTTPHARILANLSGEKNVYIDSQPLINSAIIEKILSRNTAEEQRLRLTLKAKEKERSSINSKIAFLNEIIAKKFEENPEFPKKSEEIVKAINKLDDEQKNLSTEKYSTLTQLEQSADKEIENKILSLKGELNQQMELRASIQLNISDIVETQDKLKNELSSIKQRMISQQIIHSVPVTICPICLSDFTGETLCENCRNIDKDKSIDNLSSYKKLIDDSLKEANSLIKQHKDDLKNCNQRIKEITKNLEELKEEYLQRMKNLRVPLQEIIEELKIKIKNISSQSIALKDLLSYMKELEKARAERQSINDDLKYLELEYEKASRKSGDDIKITDTWIKYYNDMYNSIFNVSDNKVKIERDYMPSINDTPIHKISSESVKLVAQLSYVYTLATLNSKLSGLSINHLGFMIFDSPKDKDLDMDKYKRFLSYLNKTGNIQIFLTGSILDELSYKEAAPNANYLPTLYETNRLLKEPV